MTQMKSAQATLNELRDGMVMVELADKLHEASQAVKTFGKPATVTIELVLAPIKGGTQGLMEQPITIAAEVKAKLPKEETPTTVFFVTDSGPSRDMTRRQSSLTGIGAVDTATGEIKHG